MRTPSLALILLAACNGGLIDTVVDSGSSTEPTDPGTTTDTGSDTGSDTATQPPPCDVPGCERCLDAGFWAISEHQSTPDGLRAALRQAMTGFNSCDYATTTKYMFLTLDNVNHEVECIYTGRKTTVTTQKPDPNTDMNTEHTWPQSEGADSIPAKCDLHHLRPSDSEANGKRANYPFGLVVGTPTWSAGGSRLGDNSAGDVVFEPRPEKRGDIARGMLYFALEYNFQLSSSELSMYRSWSHADPVDDAEYKRTMDIRAWQHHANPFVACPDMVDRAW